MADGTRAPRRQAPRPRTRATARIPASFSSAYVWDPAGTAWTRTGLLSVARTDPAIARLADGRVLVAGGYFYTGFQESGSRPIVLAHLATRPAAAAPRVDVDLPPIGYSWATADLFDPATATWSATGSMTYARSGAVAVTLTDGRVLVVGAEDPAFRTVGNPGEAYTTAEIFDPATDQFALTGSLPRVDWAPLVARGAPIDLGDPQPLAIGTLVALDDGDAVLVGAAGWWKHAGEITRSFRYDGASGRWTEIGETYLALTDESTGERWESEAENRSGALVTRLGDGRVVVAGGGASVEFSEGFESSAEAYDPGSDTWSDLPTLPAPLAYGSALTLADGSALLVGGARAPEDAFAACNEPAGTADPLRFQP